MVNISKKIVTNEEGTPIAVQIDYADWQRIEKELRAQSAAPQKTDNSFERALNESRNTWSKGKGLEYQRRIRSEWDRLDNTHNHD